MRILITPRSMTAAGLDSLDELNPLRERGWELVTGPSGRLPSEEELLNLLPSVDGWLAGVEKVSRRALTAAGKLRVISRNGVGADAIDRVAAQELGIQIVLARGANSRGVAELALALMLAGLRDIPAANTALHKGEWVRSLGKEMPDITLGVVGFGAIGQIVAQLARAMGARVLAFDPYATIEPDSGAEASTMREILTLCDVVTLHTPPPEDGRAIVGEAELALMRQDSILINTARAALVDPESVLNALNSGVLRTYAVDAFDSEPPVLDDVLRHPRSILTPHLGGYTGASTRRASELAVANLIAALADES